MDKAIELLKKGKIGVVPTDTIYGIVGSALNKKTVAEIYRLRKRSKNKPFIILISSFDDLKKFDIKVTKKQEEFLKKIWPNPVSVVLSCNNPKFSYLHRAKFSLAFRMPKNEWLLDLLKRIGPLVAPSANFEGEKSSENIKDAKKYFGDNVSFYVDEGKIKSEPSTVIRLNHDGEFKVLRQGRYRV